MRQKSKILLADINFVNVMEAEKYVCDILYKNTPVAMPGRLGCSGLLQLAFCRERDCHFLCKKCLDFF